MHPFADAPYARKRLLKRRAELQELFGRQRTAAECREDFEVTGRDEPTLQQICHSTEGERTIPTTILSLISACMSRERSGYVNVDELMTRIIVDDAFRFYGLNPGPLHQVQREIRMRCIFNCGKSEETGDRAIAIKTDDPAKKWRCHQYGCGKGGNLVGMCDLLKAGPNMGGRPRGQRFKEIAADLKAMAGVSPESPESPEQDQEAAVPKDVDPAPAEAKVNAPLKDSENERARALVNLDEKFVVDAAEMNPHAARYFRRRPFLTADTCRKWRCGYLPRDTAGDRTGGTMRGKIVYPILSEEGEVLTWFGRDPQYEEKHRKWVESGKSGKEPAKFHFVKKFHRGLELFGQQAARLSQPQYRELVSELGIIVVEGPNDVIALDRLGVPAVGICSNRITARQVERIKLGAKALAAGKVTLMLDCDAEGEDGARHAIWEIAQHCRVRLAWSLNMHGGKFRGRQPESLLPEEWNEICGALKQGG